MVTDSAADFGEENWGGGSGGELVRIAEVIEYEVHGMAGHSMSLPLPPLALFRKPNQQPNQQPNQAGFGFNNSGG